MEVNSVTVERAKIIYPVKFGGLKLKHRVVMAPLTRSRSDPPDSIPGELLAEYYARSQAAVGSVPRIFTRESASAR
jgi:N-ethylmaleimide reductase